MIDVCEPAGFGCLLAIGVVVLGLIKRMLYSAVGDACSPCTKHSKRGM